MATNSQALLADEILAVYGNINDLQLDMQIDPPNDTGELNMIQPSPFYSIHQMPPYMIQTRGQFNLLSLNAQSLNAKFDDLLLLIEISPKYTFSRYMPPGNLAEWQFWSIPATNWWI